MKDLVEKLNAALDDDERVCLAVINPDPAGGGSHLSDHYVTDEQERYEERFTPEHALRRVAAHRKILARHSSGDWPYDPEGRSDAGGYSLTEYCDGCNKPVPCPDLLDLAEEYELTDDSAPRAA